mgnify:CR=1 FL=1
MSSENFPLLTKGVYLNTAYVGLMSKPMADFRNKYENKFLYQGGNYKSDAYSSLEMTHHSLARFFGLTPDHIFVVPNFSFGIRQAIDLLPKKLNVLLIEDDYPSLISAFHEREFKIHKIPMQAELEKGIEKRLAKNDIDVLALSIVQYSTGLLIDIDYLKNLKKQHPNLILIGDGTQFLGAHAFHFNTSPFDVLAASGYKWLLAGFGNGVLMISEFYLDRIQKQVTTLNERIFNGHFNILATASLHFAIKFFEKQDFDSLIKQKGVLTEKVKNSLTENGYINPWVSKRKQHSSIFILEGDKTLYRTLVQNKIQCVLRGKGVRISFHYYNKEEDLNRLIEVLKMNRF